MFVWDYMLVFVGMLFYYISILSVVTVLFTEPLKYLFGRRRPAEEDINRRVVPLRKDVSNPAFPSGDSAQVKTL